MEKKEDVPKKFLKFLNLIKDQLFYIEGNIVVFTEPELKKNGFSLDDTQFVLNALEKYKLYSRLKKRYGFNFLPVPKSHQNKLRLLTSVDWVMAFPEKITEFQYFIELVSRESFYEFCRSPFSEDSVSGDKRAKTIKNNLKTTDTFFESRSQDEDHHILLGKRNGKNDKAHMIIDGNTGEQRVEDGRGEPTDIAPHIETTLTLANGKRIKTTRESMEEMPGISSTRPHLDIEDFYISGGPEGQRAYFKVINIGKESAMDIQYQLKADFYAPEIPKLMHLLIPGDITKLYTGVIYSSTELADRPLSNIKLALYYKGPGGKHFESGRHLIQEPRADGKFNLALGGHYE